MADMKTAVREYISLRKLAVLLYQEGYHTSNGVVHHQGLEPWTP